MKKLLVFLMVAGLVIGGIGLAQASYLQKNLPYTNETISATGVFGDWTGWPNVSFIDGHYDSYAWKNDGLDNTITGEVKNLVLTQAQAWLEVGFGHVNTSGGYLIFSQDENGEYAHLQYSVGRTDSEIIRLDGGNYTFSLTAKNDNSFFGSVTDGSGTHALTGIASDTWTAAPARVFAVGITDGLSAVAQANVDLAVPEPATMLLLGLGLVGLAGIRRKFKK